MRLRLSVELKITRKPEPQTEPQLDAPQGAESMVIHQDQPKYVGFRLDE